MKRTVRPRTASARTRTPRRPSHRIPIGLQIAARAIHGAGTNMEYVKSYLQEADALVLRMLHDPLVSLEDHDLLTALTDLGKRFDDQNIADTITAAIPATGRGNPDNWLCDYAITQQNAGLYIGLCFGFRLAAGLDGKE